MLRAWLIGIALFVLGCETRATTGMPCARSSDCASPLVCGNGRCRVQCREHRDCALLSRCIVGNDGLGVCTLQGDRCDTTVTCGEDFECRASECYDSCPASTCPAGGVCSAGVCERPVAGVDAATIDVGVVDAGVDGGALRFAEHVACTTDAQCGAGRLCARTRGGQFTCRRECTSAAECGLPETTAACGLFDGVDLAQHSLCTIPCELFEGTGCPLGEACDLVELSSASSGFVVGIDCRPVGPELRVQEESCAAGSYYDPTLCAPYFDCDGSFPNYVCQQLCTIGGALGDPCPAGLECEPFIIPARFRGVSIGSCDPI